MQIYNDWTLSLLLFCTWTSYLLKGCQKPSQKIAGSAGCVVSLEAITECSLAGHHALAELKDEAKLHN